MKRSLSLLAVLAVLTPVAGGQSLGEAAAKERERRKNTPPAKVYTDSDVRTVAPSAPADDGAATTSGAKPSTEGQASAEGAKKADEKSPDELRAEEAKAWREQVGQINDQIARLEADIKRLEAETDDTRGYAYSNRRTVALENLEKARAERSAARQKLDDLLESGRRKGLRAP